MWDESECQSIDTLDGENDQEDQTLAMGEIHSTESWGPPYL